MTDSLLSSLAHTHITFIGGGNMGRALIGGLLAGGLQAKQITVVEPFTATAEKLKADFSVAIVNSIDGLQIDSKLEHVVVMAVKPQDFKQVAVSLAPHLKAIDAQRLLIISIAAGIRLSSMANWLSHSRCIRAMPNTPALIGMGMTGLCAGSSVDAQACSQAAALCNAVGQSVWVKDENLIDAVTALSGSGPAYVFAFLEALQRGGEKLGLDPVAARALAYATLQGAAQLAINADESAGSLREKVTSKGGTTAAALAVLQESNWQGILEAALAAAAKRGQAMGDELAQ
ncbi:MAG: pyrroline-5-carboxylate reductase [Polynucleobacter sp.]